MKQIITIQHTQSIHHTNGMENSIFKNRVVNLILAGQPAR